MLGSDQLILIDISSIVIDIIHHVVIFSLNYTEDPAMEHKLQIQQTISNKIYRR